MIFLQLNCGLSLEIDVNGDSIIDLHSRDAAYTPPVNPHAVVFPENTEEVLGIVKLFLKIVRLSHLGWAVRSRVK